MYPNLKLQLWRSGIRQNRLAQMLGVNETLLSKIINGYREAGPEFRGRVASLLQREEAWLFESAQPGSGQSNDPPGRNGTRC